MTLRERIGNWLSPPAPAQPVAVRAAVSNGRSGRPTYATTLGGLSTLPRDQSLELMGAFYAGVPVYKRAIQILAGMCGAPLFEGDEGAVKDLIEWSENVQHGRVGRGLSPWLKDHLGQSLIFGYGVGEAEIGAGRKEVTALWSYPSPSIGFRTDALGELEIVQQQPGRGGLIPLNRETTVLTVSDPMGCNPNGQSLFMACPTFAQIWMEMGTAYRSTWRRNGIPFFHMHTELPKDLDDPDGDISSAIVAQNEAAFNEAMKSQVVNGKAKDIFTASVGQTTIKTVGFDGQVMDIQSGKRNIVEEIVVATGIPPWMLGYSWSTTERLSTQQADTLLAWIDCMRTATTPGIRQMIDLRQRLAGKRGKVSFRWPDVNLQDLTETATAALNEARALAEKEKVAEKLWRNGVYDQSAYAEFVTGEAAVVTAMTEPFVTPAPLSPAGGEPGDTADGARGYSLETARKIMEEAEAEYPQFARCNGKH